jgi:hypothetical protein
MTDTTKDVTKYTATWFEANHSHILRDKPLRTFPMANLYLHREVLNKVGGVYAVYGITDNKFYIGCTMNLYERLQKHAKAATKSSTALIEAVKKYGVEDFIGCVLQDLGTAHYSTFGGNEQLQREAKKNVTRLLLDAEYNILISVPNPRVVLYNDKLMASGGHRSII